MSRSASGDAAARLTDDVRTVLATQGLMQTLGVELRRAEIGVVELALTPDTRHTQHNGFVHAGVLASIADAASGAAAHSVAPPGGNVLSVEFKMNLLAPAYGDVLRAVATVVRAGKTLVVVEADCFTRRGDEPERHVARMLSTMMVRGPSDA